MRGGVWHNGGFNDRLEFFFFSFVNNFIGQAYYIDKKKFSTLFEALRLMTALNIISKFGASKKVANLL